MSLRRVFLLMVSGVLVAGCSPPATADQLSINGEAVPLTLYQALVRTEQQKLERGGMIIDWHSTGGRHRLAVIESSVIRGLVRFVVIEQIAGERGITVDDAALDRALESSYQALGGATAFDTALEQAGTTRSEFRLILRYRMLEGKLRLVASGQFDRVVNQALAAANVVVTVPPCAPTSRYPACLVET